MNRLLPGKKEEKEPRYKIVIEQQPLTKEQLARELALASYELLRRTVGVMHPDFAWRLVPVQSKKKSQQDPEKKSEK